MAVVLDALGPRGPYRARRTLTVPDVTGAPVASLSLVPRLYVSRTLAALRPVRPLPYEERIAALAAAARHFTGDEIAGLSFAEYERAVARVSGVPLTVVQAATASIAETAARAGETTGLPRPAGAAGDWRDPRTRDGSAVWTRRGAVFGVHAAGNHPGPHGLWLEAVALGYRVAVRPSRREPLTPHRLVTALHAAGLGAHVALLPTDHDAAGELLRGADLGLVYGGDDVVAKYAGTTILPQGPGRAKILLTAGTDWRRHLDTIVDSVAGQGGVACINATAVLVDGDPAPLARALAERLAALPSLPPQDPKAVLPVQSLEGARALSAFVLAQSAGTVPWLGGTGIAEDLGDGSAVLRPAVFQAPRADARQLRVEVPFPCVWVAPWSPADGLAPLRDSLVLTVFTGDDRLVDDLLDEPTIANVYVGDHPTHWLRPGVPHDGYLADFLMRTKTVIR
ncbi:aldehyde dehydrogenase family protein [Dactylosporangium sp. NPDC000244]|uniref:aldehyde dehydrogenase family protein n=1 Tax=Dactylosporangium sp. NPDC000244 TaxID=3154365 RepID=UPI00332B40AC